MNADKVLEAVEKRIIEECDNMACDLTKLSHLVDSYNELRKELS